jgi:hypothetical protein
MFSNLVEKEIERSRKIHGNIHSFHEGLGIIYEEYSEFRDEIFEKKHNKEAILEELVQLAASCRKLAEDMNLLEPKSE